MKDIVRHFETAKDTRYRKLDKFRPALASVVSLKATERTFRSAQDQDHYEVFQSYSYPTHTVKIGCVVPRRARVPF